MAAMLAFSSLQASSTFFCSTASPPKCIAILCAKATWWACIFSRLFCAPMVSAASIASSSTSASAARRERCSDASAVTTVGSSSVLRTRPEMHHRLGPPLRTQPSALPIALRFAQSLQAGLLGTCPKSCRCGGAARLHVRRVWLLHLSSTALLLPLLPFRLSPRPTLLLSGESCACGRDGGDQILLVSLP